MHALLIAIEEYPQAAELPSIPFAANDLHALRQALLDLGMEGGNIHVLEGAAATRAAIREKAKRVARFALENEPVLFYFAGIGLFAEGKNWLAAADALLDTPKATAVSMAEVLEIFAESDSTTVGIFLDCHLSRPPDGQVPGAAPFSTEELAMACASNDSPVVFVSCKGDEQSWTDPALKRGIWNHYLVKALCGEAAGIGKGERLLADNLQSYLSTETMRHVTLQRVRKETQTPLLFGQRTNAFVIADLSVLLDKRRLEKGELTIPSAAQVTISAERTGMIKDLPGYKSFHKLPNDFSEYAANFVRTVGSELLITALDEMATAVRKELGYKRRDLVRSDPSSGSASLITPDFDFVVQITQDTESTARYSLRNIVENFKNPTLLLDERFNDLFAAEFHELAFTAPTNIDVEALIDRIEALENETITVEYKQSDTSKCRVRMAGFKYEIAIDRHGLTMVSATKQSPLQLASAFQELQKQLQGAAILKLTD
jgi:uncharacterized caspase-like protein